MSKNPKKWNNLTKLRIKEKVRIIKRADLTYRSPKEEYIKNIIKDIGKK